MTGSIGDKNPAAWHPVAATAKWHAFVEGERATAFNTSSERNRVHEKHMHDARNHEQGPPTPPREE